MDFTVSNKDFCDRIEELLALKRIKKETMYTACGISRSTFSISSPPFPQNKSI